MSNLLKNTLQRRNRQDRLFRRLSLSAIIFASMMLFLLLGAIFSQGWGAFINHTAIIQSTNVPNNLPSSDRAAVVAIVTSFLQTPVESKQEVLSLFSTSASQELAAWLKNRTGQLTLTLSDDADLFLKNENIVSTLKASQKKILRDLRDLGVIHKQFNSTFLTGGDSREPELVGVFNALKGSLLTLVVAFVMAFPIGVATAIYLTEYVQRSRWQTIVEININNLAAVPSIVFGLLGLSLFIQFFGWPRSTPLVGGAVLALIILPTLVISTTTALKSVPHSIRMAALAMGASKTQMVFHHVVPYSIPGIMTGSILSMAHILGETAPLLLIGMVAFIADVANNFLEPTAGAIIVLLLFLILINTVAIILRHKNRKIWS